MGSGPDVFVPRIPGSYPPGMQAAWPTSWGPVKRTGGQRGTQPGSAGDEGRSGLLPRKNRSRRDDQMCREEGPQRPFSRASLWVVLSGSHTQPC